MAESKFYFQGTSSRTSAVALDWLLTWPSAQAITLATTSVNLAGVRLLDKSLQAAASKTTVICGIRNGQTTYQGLRRLVELGIMVFLIDTGTTKRIYHPKLYLADTGKAARLLIGSSNLTLAGLQQNLEVGIEMNLDRRQADDAALLQKIQEQFAGLLQLGGPLVTKVTNLAELDNVRADGALADEPGQS